MDHALLLITVTIILNIVIVPSVYWGLVRAKQLEREQEREQLLELLAQRNGGVIRHFGLGIGAVVMVWWVQANQRMDVHPMLIETMVVYAVNTMLFAVLESLLAQKIARVLLWVPEKQHHE